MLTGIDHVIVAVADLAAAASSVRRGLGLAVVAGGAHPTTGTANRLVWCGDTYLELVAVADPDVARGTWFGAAVVAALERGHGAVGGSAAPVGVALASDDLEADAAARGGELATGSRIRPDGRTVRWRLARAPHRSAGGAPAWPLVFLIEHDRTAAEWTAGERAERAAMVHPLGTAARLASVSLRVPAVPAAVAGLGRSWGLAFRPSLAGGGARDASVGHQTVRLVRARSGQPSMSVGLVAGRDGREVDLLGCHWILVPT